MEPLRIISYQLSPKVDTEKKSCRIFGTGNLSNIRDITQESEWTKRLWNRRQIPLDRTIVVTSELQ
jgi:hypothetical protein